MPHEGHAPGTGPALPFHEVPARTESGRRYQSQKARILEHFKTGATLTQAQARVQFGCSNLPLVVLVLKRQGWDIVSEEDPESRRKVYWLAGARKDPNGKDETDVDAAQEEAVEPDDAEDVPAAAEDVPPPAAEDVPAPVAGPGSPAGDAGPEVLSHHVANPDDPGQILRTFREYCAPSHGRKVEISPGWARQLLKLNWDNNRDTSKAQVEAYADAMKAGEWKYNDAQIAFDRKGRMLNGQHRLTACVLAGCPFVTDIAFDIDPDSYATIDRGRAKSGADVAKYEGVPERRATHSAAVKILYRFDRGIEYGAKLSAEQERIAFRDFRDLEPWVKTAHAMAYKKTRGIKGPRGLLAAVLYLCARVDRDAARTFAEELDAGVGGGLHQRHPAYVAQRTINDRKNFLGGNGYAEYRRILVKAWENRRKGIEVSYFKFSAQSEEWPEGSRRPWGDKPPGAQAAE